MEILIIAKGYPPAVGGVENYSYTLAEGLARSHKVHVLTFRENSEQENTYEEKASVVRISLKSSETINFLALFISLFKILIINKPDIIIATTWKVGIPYALLSYIAKVPFIVVAHGAEITRHKHSKSLLWMMNFVYKKANIIISVSNFSAKILEQYLNTESSKIKIIWNGVEDKSINVGSQSRSRKHINFNNSDKILLTVSRLDSRKGHNLVIRCLPEVIKVHPDIKYIIVGKGPTSESLIQLAQNLNLLNTHVFFIGYVSEKELPYYYQASDIFIMLNQMKDDKDFEGFGLVFAEAGLYGKMCIAGDNGGPKEVIINEKTGYLVNPENLSQVIDTIIEIFNDPERIIEMGKQNHERTLVNFTVQAMIEKYNKLIEKII